ncbi:MAG: ComEC/Rec2 family competence protein [bacterium]|nr:ComEC/Rec2 family competence protein [bacterium]
MQGGYKWIVAAASGFLVGTLIASFSFDARLFFLLVSIGIVLVYLFLVRSRLTFAFALLGLIFAGFGFGRYLLAISSAPELHGSAAVLGRVMSVDDRYGRQDIYVKTSTLPGRVLVRDRSGADVFAGDRIDVFCALEVPEPFDGFRYDRFLAAKHVYTICEPQGQIITDSQNTVFGQLDRFRAGVQTHIDRSYGEPHATLLYGLLFGEADFSESWENRFQETGTTHIVAASGYNVAIIVIILSGMLFFLGFKRQQIFAVIMVGIGVYAVLAGGDAPIIRAAVMGAIVLIARTIGRRSAPLILLLCAATIMLLINPLLLRDDIGFQLSFASTIGLVYFGDKFSRWLAFLPEAFSIRDSAASTFAATAATLPIIVFSFDRFSLISPLVNLLVLPLIPYTILFGVLGLVVPVESITWSLLHLMLELIRTLESLPFSAINL